MSNFRQIVPTLKPKTAIKVAYTGTPGLSAAVGATTIQLCASSDCHILIGSAPVATADHTFLPAKTIVNYSCLATDKVSVIQDSAGGNLFITPGS